MAGSLNKVKEFRRCYGLLDLLNVCLPYYGYVGYKASSMLTFGYILRIITKNHV